MIKTNEKICTGCKACLIACSAFKFKVYNPNKALLRIEEKVPYNKIYFCDQCGKCADVCPEKAIYKKGEVWLIDHEKCIGCGKCAEACPLDVIKIIDNKAWKCDSCGECVRHCTIGALKYE